MIILIAQDENNIDPTKIREGLSLESGETMMQVAKNVLLIRSLRSSTQVSKAFLKIYSGRSHLVFVGPSTDWHGSMESVKEWIDSALGDQYSPVSIQ